MTSQEVKHHSLLNVHQYDLTPMCVVELGLCGSGCKPRPSCPQELLSCVGCYRGGSTGCAETFPLWGTYVCQEGFFTNVTGQELSTPSMCQLSSPLQWHLSVEDTIGLLVLSVIQLCVVRLQTERPERCLLIRVSCIERNLSDLWVPYDNLAARQTVGTWTAVDTGSVVLSF